MFARLLCASKDEALGCRARMLREGHPRRPPPREPQSPLASRPCVPVQSPCHSPCGRVCGSPPAADLGVSPEGGLEVVGSDWHQLRLSGASAGCVGAPQPWCVWAGTEGAPEPMVGRPTQARAGGFSGSAAVPAACVVTPPPAGSRQRGARGCCHCGSVWPWGGWGQPPPPSVPSQSGQPSPGSRPGER